MATEGVPGFRVVVTRLFYDGDARVRSEDFRTKYEPENEVRCGVTPAAASAHRRPGRRRAVAVRVVGGVAERVVQPERAGVAART